MDDNGDSPGELSFEEIGEKRYLVRLPPGEYKKFERPDRRSEVAMVIQRTPGWLLLQTKLRYPPGIFRIPTGRINHGEESEETMLRELQEEANLRPVSHDHLFRLQYMTSNKRQKFYTDCFLINAPRGELKPNDLSEGISAWREARFSELPDVARDLCQLDPPRVTWGLLRSALPQLLGILAAKGQLNSIGE